MAEQVLEKKALGFDESCVYIGGVSRPTMYGLDIPSFKMGRRRYFLREDLDRFLAERAGRFYPEVNQMIAHDLAGGSNEYLATN